MPIAKPPVVLVAEDQGGRGERVARRLVDDNQGGRVTGDISPGGVRGLTDKVDGQDVFNDHAVESGVGQVDGDGAQSVAAVPVGTRREVAPLTV